MKRIGRYEIRDELGQGGMASVYRAHDPRFDRDVALKTLSPELLHDPTFRARFEIEARTIAALEHPAIVPVYDFGEEDGQPYLVMRLMTGRSLDERLKKGPLALDEVARILARLAPALDYAHQKGVIHRDIKPANILFDQHNEPYIGDFGIARLAESTATLTGRGIVGTPAYMSPEQGRGEPDIDGGTDIYALGAILFEMLTGRVPYEAGTPTGQIIRHITDPIPEVAALRSGLPGSTQAVVARAMAKRKYARYPRAADLAADVAALTEGRKIHGGKISPTAAILAHDVQAALGDHNPSPPAKTQRSKQSFHRTWLVRIAIVIGLLGLGWGMSKMGQHQTQSQTEIARQTLAPVVEIGPTAEKTTTHTSTSSPQPPQATPTLPPPAFTQTVVIAAVQATVTPAVLQPSPTNTLQPTATPITCWLKIINNFSKSKNVTYFSYVYRPNRDCGNVETNEWHKVVITNDVKSKTIPLMEGYYCFRSVAGNTMYYYDGPSSEFVFYVKQNLIWTITSSGKLSR